MVKITGYLKTAYCIVTIVVSAHSSCWAADSSLDKGKTQPTATWQSHLAKAVQHFHISENDLSNQAINLKKSVKVKIPNATPEEIQKGRAAVNESLKLALQTMPPLAGLKDETLAKKVLELTGAVGYMLSLDAREVANVFQGWKNAGTVQQQLVILRRCDSLGQRDDRLAQDISKLIDKTFGTNGQKGEWKDEHFKPEAIAECHAMYKQAADKMHDASVKMQKQIAIWEKKDPNTKVTK